MSAAERTLEQGRERVNRALERWLPSAAQAPTRLNGAVRYAVLGSGKRLRPTLVYATGDALGAPAAGLDAPACAVELIHCYSLVHDDLPAMDDDDLRRGQPTCHCQYDEATAILAGDALQALAFELAATDPGGAGLEPRQRARMVAVLADAAGPRGMVAGQALDLAATGGSLDLAGLERIHRHKTAALIRASVALGAVAGDADRGFADRLDRYAAAIGLAFQIVDDVLDVVGDTATLGKAQGADLELGKCTYPALLGVDGARRYAAEIRDQALAALEGVEARFAALVDLAHFVVDRSA